MSRRCLVPVVLVACSLLGVVTPLVEFAPSAGAAITAPQKRKPTKVTVRDRPPIGSWDSLNVVGNSIQLSGWAADPDSPWPARVLVLTKLGLASTYAMSPRPDVNRVAGANRGWSLTVGGLPPGQTLACMGVVNYGPAGGSKLLSCRVFTVPDPAPNGWLETVSVQRDRIQVSGWAGSATGAATEVRLSVAGQVVVGTPSIGRPDVAATGLAGANAGFELQSPSLPSGTYPICVSTNLVGQSGRFLGCQSVTISPPIGNFDAAVNAGEGITISGWAADVDAPGESLTVHASMDRLDDFSDPISVSLVANAARPDVGAAVAGIGSNHGFAGGIALLSAGTYRVCVSVDPAGLGPAVALGCRDVGVVGHRPVGAVDLVTAPTATTVRVVGWVRDPDTTSPLSITIRVGAQTIVSTASLFRSDVGSHGFDVTVAGIGSGPQAVCVTATNVGVGADVTLPCGSVVMGATRVATTGAPGPPTRVGPPIGTPLDDIDRDAGISVRLGDGSTFWMFGDSFEAGSSGSLRYFVNNTAAWAAAGAPAVTRDGVVGGASPATFVTPVSDLGCPSRTPTQVMWPLSAVAVPQSATVDRVIAYFQNICLGPNLTTASRGVAVVQWTYDRTAPPVDQVVTGTVVSQQIFPTNTYGNAAVLGADGFIYSYACFGPAGGGLPDAYGPCKVARVLPESVGDVSSYTYWNGTTFVFDPALAAAMVLPNAAGGVNNPVASLGVTWDSAHGVYVMAYSPWPGFTDTITIRVASAPQGPWSAPVDIKLPGCNDTVGGSGFYCYAGTSQPQFSVAPTGSGDGLLGLGYYDQLVAVGPNHGSYQFVTVPFRVYLPA